MLGLKFVPILWSWPGRESGWYEKRRWAGGGGDLVTACLGVCSIFLHVNRSISEIHKPRAIFSLEILYKKYVFIYL
jgi:hypothetical protein